MSLSYWVVEGVGLCAEEIEPYINQKKLAKLFLEQLSNEDEEVEKFQRMIDTGDFSGFDYDEYMYGNPFENFADVLTHCDDSDSLTFGDDGEGSHYLYYPPSMPWWLREDEPRSLDEVHDRIIAAVQKITDMKKEEILCLINDDLFVVGCG